MITFRLHRSGLVLLIICGLLAGGLLFAAGWLGGMQYVSRPAPKIAVPKLATPPPPAQPAAPAEQPMALRLGSFIAEEDAKALVQELAARKIDAAILPMTDGATTVYTVRSGKYPTHAAAENAAASMEKQGLSPVVVPAE